MILRTLTYPRKALLNRQPTSNGKRIKDLNTVKGEAVRLEFFNRFEPHNP